MRSYTRGTIDEMETGSSNPWHALLASSDVEVAGNHFLFTKCRIKYLRLAYGHNIVVKGYLLAP